MPISIELWWNLHMKENLDFSKKISVVVPVFNVEPFLDKCIDSIVKQTYKNLEIILVDDGSSDNCPQICDEWARKDERIKVVHKKNGGLSDARNAGMDIATGEYMGFVDSDDWIHKDMLYMLYNNMRINSSDISVCGVEMLWTNGTERKLLTRSGNTVLDKEDAMRAIIEESWLKQPVWNKLYKTRLIKDIKFPAGKYHEDVFWSYQAIAKAKKVSIFDSIGYYYVQHQNSIMGQPYSVKRLDAVEAKCMRLKYIEKKFPNLTQLAALDLLFSCVYHGQRALECLDRNQQIEVFDYLQGVLKKNQLLNRKYKSLSKKQKVWMLSSKISLVCTCKMRNHLKIGF